MNVFTLPSRIHIRDSVVAIARRALVILIVGLAHDRHLLLGGRMQLLVRPLPLGVGIGVDLH